MEPIRRRPQDITQGRPLSARPAAPTGQRPVFSDFTGRPPARPIVNAAPARPLGAPLPGAPGLPSTQASQPVPRQTTPPQHHSAAPHHSSSPAGHTPVTAPHQSTSPAAPRMVVPNPMEQSRPVQPPTSTNAAFAQSAHHTITPPTEQPTARPHALPAKPVSEHKSSPSRAGLAGFVCFIILGGLLLSPFLPSKTFDSFPGSSQSSSSGDDSLACIHELGAISTTVRYNHKLGSPITYSYATTTTQKATCDTKQETAVAGRAGQFNPLGLVIDVALAIIVSIVVSKVWRRIFHEQD